MIKSDVLKGLTLSLSVFLAACGSESENASSSPSEGEKLVKANCLVCHSPGINGAPIIGNKKMWSKRLPKGKDVLVQHAIEGFGLMPAKGGRTELSDEQIALAVEYMMSQVQ